MGYKVDEGGSSAPGSMLSLPWRWFTNPSGAPETNDVIASAPKATQSQIAAGWLRVKGAQDKKAIGGGQPFWTQLTNLRLDDTGMRQATTRWIANAEPTLRQSFPRYDSTQADAQMTILNMAYGMGPAFVPVKGFHQFAAAMNAVVPDYVEAANQCTFQPDSDDAIHEHNELSRLLLGNAKAWQSTNVDPSVLWWPGTTPPGGSGGGGGGSSSLTLRERGPHAAPRRSWLGGLVKTVLLVGGGALGVFAVRGFVRQDPWTRRPAALARRLVRAEGKIESKVDRAVLGAPDGGAKP
jgi:hypothetical protein